MSKKQVCENEVCKNGKSKDRDFSINAEINMKFPIMGSSCMHPLSMVEYYRSIKKRFRK